MSINLVVPEEVELTTLLDELRKLSWASADVLMAYARGQEPPFGFPKTLTIEEGGDGPVSAADMAVNELLISGLKDNLSFKEWDILSEESSKKKTFQRDDYKKDWCWIIDPLDGTKDFKFSSLEFSSLKISHSLYLRLSFKPEINNSLTAMSAADTGPSPPSSIVKDLGNP